MERGREGRRGGGATVSAPRRPRTGGFKDTPVGEDGDEMMDDVQNPRLRERPKKDSSVTAVQGLLLGSSGSVPRNKRKRLGSQEMQCQARTAAEDVDETTDDTEMGASEDDDDPPPPPIARRSGKVRLQGKFPEDAVCADLPTVPRKARTAILKRPQEMQPLIEVPSGPTVIPRTPILVNAPSSSSVASLKSGRRVKPSISKPRAAKLPKMSTSMAISEQEVEVAEALFDLARLCTTHPMQEARLDSSMERKPKIKSEAETESRSDPIELLDNLAGMSSAPSAATPLFLSHSSLDESLASLTSRPAAISSVLPPPVHTPAITIVMAPSLLPSPSPSVTAPAEAPKRKRPRVRSKPEEMASASHLQPLGNSSNSAPGSFGLTVPSRLDCDQILISSPRTADKGSPRAEACACTSSVLIALPKSCASPSSTYLTPNPVDAMSVAKVQSSSPLEQSVEVDEMAKLEVSSRFSTMDSKHIFVLDRKSAPCSVPSPPGFPNLEIGKATSNLHGNESLHKLELKRKSSLSDGIHPNEFELMVGLPSESSWLATEDGDKEGAGEVQEQGGFEEHGELNEQLAPCQQERLIEITIEENEVQRSKERATKREWELGELAEQVRPERSGKEPTLGSWAQKVERTSSSVDSTIATTVSARVDTLPISVGMVCWGEPPTGSAAATAVWPGPVSVSVGATASMVENTPSLQMQHPYIIQAHQPQPWKRCASHVYIAHFIDVQQQIHRHPLIQAAYQNSASVYGAKSYNLNIPLPSSETLFGSGGSFVGGTTCASVGCADGSALGLGAVLGSERNIGAATVTENVQGKDQVYFEASSARRETVQQLQPPQVSPNLALQAGSGLGFPVTQAVTTALGRVAAGAPPVNEGPVGAVVSGGASGLQGGFPFPFQAAAHFNPGFNGSPTHMPPQQAAQFFNSSFYTTHLLHQPAHLQQQMQQPTSVSGGSTSTQKQQVLRNFPPNSQHQSVPFLAPPAQAPSRSHLQHNQGAKLPQMLRPNDGEGTSTGESKSAAEGNFSMLQSSVCSQGNPSVVASPGSASSFLVTGGPLQSMPPQDFKLLAALGTKQSKQQQGQFPPQQQPLIQQQVITQHQSIVPLQMSLKGMDHQSSETFSGVSIGAINRGGAISAGPLGLTPVAAVMAPQGHAMLQNVADSSRGHSQHQHLHSVGPSHQNSFESGHQRLSQMQRIPPTTSSVEDLRKFADGSSFPSRNGREVVEDKKVSAKRGSTSNQCRVDIDTAAATQESPTGSSASAVSRFSGNVGSTLNLLCPGSGLLISRAPGPSSASTFQQVGTVLPGSQNSKQAIQRMKHSTASSGATSQPSAHSQLAVFSERAPQGPALSNKMVGPSSLSGQNVEQSTQPLRQGQLPHSHLKLSNRSSLGTLSATSVAAPQVVVGAVTAKSQQGSQQQQSRLHGQVASSVGSSARLPSSNSGGPSTSSSIPLPPLPPASKSLPTCIGKTNLSCKSSFPLSLKPLSGSSSGKRMTPSSGSHVSLISSPSTLVQNLASKSQAHQLQGLTQHYPQPPSQQQNLNQHHMLPPKPFSPQSLPHSPLQPPQVLIPVQQHYHQQHTHSNSQQPHQTQSKQMLLQSQQTHQMQCHLFLQNSVIQPPTGSSLNSHLTQPQPYSPQQIHQTSTPIPQLHQQSSQFHQQQQQQLHQQQHNSLMGPELSGTTANGSASLGSTTLTLGTGSNANNSSPRAAESDTLVTISGTGAGASSSPSTNANTQEQVNGIRLLSGSSPSRTPQMALSGSLGLQPVSCHAITVVASVGKSFGSQFPGNNYMENSSSGSVFTLSVAPPSLPSNHNSASFNSVSNKESLDSAGLTSSVHLGQDGRPLFGASSLSSTLVSQIAVASPGQSSSSSLLMPTGPVSKNSTPAGMIGQKSSSVVQP